MPYFQLIAIHVMMRTMTPSAGWKSTLVFVGVLAAMITLVLIGT